MVILVFAFIGIIHVKEILHANDNLKSILIHAGSLIFFISVIVFCYLYSPIKYELTDRQLIINRPVKNITINFTDISEVRSIDSSELSGTIRTFGVGGLFGYFGKYYNSTVGKMNWYTTQMRNRILIQMNTCEKIIISPDDLSMLDKLLEKIIEK